MKKGKEEALRWYRQAEHDLKVARHNFEGKFYSDACFMCEQASQKALKAFLIFKTGRTAFGEHSIQTLAQKCLPYNQKFKEVIDYGRVLDRYYIPTRYPDALSPPAVPFETYNEEDALNALDMAGRIISLVGEELKA